MNYANVSSLEELKVRRVAVTPKATTSRSAKPLMSLPLTIMHPSLKHQKNPSDLIVTQWENKTLLLLNHL